MKGDDIFMKFSYIITTFNQDISIVERQVTTTSSVMLLKS